MEKEPIELHEYKSDHDILIEVRTLLGVTMDGISEFKKQYVMQAEFWPVKMLVFGCVGLMLTLLVTAIVYLALNH